MRLLITGASGKLGGRVVERLLRDLPEVQIRAMTHSRDLRIVDRRLEVVKGNIADRAFVEAAMEGVTHVVHMASCKEMPEFVMDVTVKGMFWLLEAFRLAKGQYFILVGGDAAIGHFFYPAPAPVTETSPHKAAPGCYSLSKVLEEVMLTQAHFQYGIEGCCLRSPWIMADDDLRYALTFGPDVFGMPRWHEEVGEAEAARYAARQSVALALAADGRPLKRSIIGVDDVVDAILAAIEIRPPGCQTFNLAMEEPFDYGRAAAYISNRFGHEAVEIPTPFHSVWIDNMKARQLLNWSPKLNTQSLVDAAWAFQPANGSRREVVYPG